MQYGSINKVEVFASTRLLLTSQTILYIDSFDQNVT